MTWNYAAKLTFKLSDNHQLEGSVYGDPATTPLDPFRRVTMDNTSAFSKLDYGSRNAVVTLQRHTVRHLDGGGVGHLACITTSMKVVLPINKKSRIKPKPGWGSAGSTLFKAWDSWSPRTARTTAPIWIPRRRCTSPGQHTFSIGYRMERPFYNGQRANSGPQFTLPGVNMDGTPLSNFVANEVVGSTANENWYLRKAAASCTACPMWTPPGAPSGYPIYLQTLRSEFALDSPFGKSFHTSGRYHAVYANDAWSPNRFVTLNLGLRWEQQYLKGQDLAYTFTDNWSPRIGISIDPKGDRKNKIFANYGRFTYGIPLDLAERSLTNEQDMFSLKVIPTINADNTVSPPDPAAISSGSVVLNKAAAGINSTPFVSFSSSTPIYPGTKMSYLDEFVVGGEHEFPGGIILSGKFIRRDLKRIVEDTGGISPEAANAGVPQQFAIANVSKSTDIFTNPIEKQYPTSNSDDTTGATQLAAAIAAGCPIDTSGSITDAGSAIYVDPVTDTFGNVVAPGAACFGSGGPDA